MREIHSISPRSLQIATALFPPGNPKRKIVVTISSCVVIFMFVIALALSLLYFSSSSSSLFSTSLLNAVSSQVQAASSQQKGATNQAKKSDASPTVNASHALVRIDQTVQGQEYSTDYPYGTWWPSACSAASMSEVMDAYGHSYTIADVLKVEAGLLGEITPDLGLLEPTGIDKTVAHFGFTTQTLVNPTLDQVLTTANRGQPVIVSFPPPTSGGNWTGGHILVVLGSITQNGTTYVHLADSSRLDMQYMKIGAISQRGTFLYYWRGLAKVLSPSANSVVGPPTITADFINQVLSAYGSPAAGQGQALYNLGVQYGIDPAFALAFFQHESTFGKFGEANSTLSLGNLRCIPNAACINASGQTCQPGDSCYAAFPTWQAGFEAWYKLIRNLYVAGWGLSTVDQIIPKYAPSADNNNEAAYIASVEHSIDVWHSGQVMV